MCFREDGSFWGLPPATVRRSIRRFEFPLGNGATASTMRRPYLFSSSGWRRSTVAPAFARSKREVDGALRGYRELNRRGLSLVEPGGTITEIIDNTGDGANTLVDVRALTVDGAGTSSKMVFSMIFLGSVALRPVTTSQNVTPRL